ncbi:MAG: YafY family transcriptional regulator [Rhodoferax sp.]|nr:YafY family transcriptional regulator [Rhodoferax sp.]
MSQSTARTLAALELLQARQRVTGPELAERLQVDARTARRYIARLVEMGVPVVSERGRDGAYRLATAYKLPPMMFSDEEALALAIGLVAARDLGLGQTRIAVDSALIKLERVMPTALKVRMRAVERAIQLDPLSPGTALHHQALALLSEAVQKQQRVRLLYQPDSTQTTERLFDAWGLAFYLRQWYVVGYCHLRKGQRSFRLDRIVSVDWVAASFAPPVNFDALAALRHGVATMKRGHAAEVVLHASLEQATDVLYAELGTLEALKLGRGARVLLRSEVDDLDWFARELARLPFRFEVRKPVALRTTLLTLAKHLQADALRAPSA